MKRAADSTPTGAQRILDAAIHLFGEHGFRATPLKAIAAEADVSQALIVHHYGTKNGLRAACDAHVAHLVRVRKAETVDAEQRVDPFTALHRLQGSRPLLRYLTRALTEGGEGASELIDGMIDDAVDHLDRGEEAGVIKSSAVPRDRAALLVIWSLGALALHEQVHRLFGADFLAGGAPSEDLHRYLRPAIELYTQGLVQPGSFDRLAEALAGSTTGAETRAADEAPDCTTTSTAHNGKAAADASPRRGSGEGGPAPASER